MFSNRSDQGRSLRKLLQGPPSAPRTVRSRSRRKTAHRLEPHEIDSLVEAYGAGTTVNELALQFSIHLSTVSVFLKRQGVPRRHRLLEDHERASERALRRRETPQRCR
jgi:hypothetical protein